MKIALNITVFGLVIGVVFIACHRERVHLAHPHNFKPRSDSFTQAPKVPDRVSTVVANVLQNPRRGPVASTIPRLSADEEKLLIETYRRIPSPTNRYGIVKTLAFGGADATADLFRYSLEEEFVGQSLNLSEEDSLLVTARLLGVLGEGSPKARQFLLQGCKIGYWAQRPLWKGTRDKARLLANNCVQGVGLLSDGQQILMQWIQGEFPRDDAINSHGAVLTAAASADEIERLGRQTFFDHVFMQRNSFKAFKSWAATEQAQPWLRWAEAHGYPVLTRNPKNAK